MKTLCCIPARGGSKRLPGKNIMLVNGKPLIAYTIEHVKNAKLVDRIVVATDDDDIARVALEHGAEIVMRPQEISTDTSPIEDAVRHTIRELSKRDGYESDAVLLPQANIIHRSATIIDDVISTLAGNSKLTAVMSCYEVNQRPEWMKLISGDTLVPRMECSSFRQQDLPKYYLADGAATCIRTSVVMETEGLSGAHKFCGDAIGYVIQDRIFGVEVDDKDDVLAAEVLLQYIERKG